MSERLSVEIWSDVACPWCYLGKRAFDKALGGFAHADNVDVIFHSFQLAPDAPETSEISEREYLQREKGLSPDQVQAAFDTITGRGRELGLAYDFDAIHNGNTRRAHRLIHFAGEKGIQSSAIDALFSAYFEQGVAVGTRDALVEIAVRLGLDEAEARAAIDSPEFDVRVEADIREAKALGIQGVPYFVIDRRYGVSGAQPVEAFAEILGQVWSAKESVDV